MALRQHGHGSCFRNALLDGEPQRLVDAIPVRGKLEFDFVSYRTVPPARVNLADPAELPSLTGTPAAIDARLSRPPALSCIRRNCEIAGGLQCAEGSQPMSDDAFADFEADLLLGGLLPPQFSVPGRAWLWRWLNSCAYDWLALIARRDAQRGLVAAACEF